MPYRTGTERQEDDLRTDTLPAWARAGTGYRDENLYGEGFRDPVAIVRHEVGELMNIGICGHMAKNAPIFLKGAKAEHRALIEDAATLSSADELEDDRLEALLLALEAVCRRTLGRRDFAVWLCATPQDVYESYVAPFPDSSYETWREGAWVRRYAIPEDAMALDDLGDEGALFCWRREQTTAKDICLPDERHVASLHAMSNQDERLLTGDCRVP
jgi:hypothetical protein